MKRLLIFSAAAAATVTTAVPAVAGLAGNPSFSHKLPVKVPSQAKVVEFEDGRPASTLEPRHSRGPAAVPRTSEPGDDNGGVTRNPEPSDDNGGLTRHVEPGDDRGSAASTKTNDGSGDKGSHGGSSGRGH
jgi:hypothetical protein